MPAGPTAPARTPVLEGSSAVLAEQAALQADMEAIGQPKTMDGKLLLSVISLQYHLPCHFQLLALAYALQ